MGTWAYLMSLVTLGFLFINVGFDSIHYQYSGKDNFKDYIGSYLLIKLMLLIINISLTLAIIGFSGLYSSPNIFVLLLLIFSQISLSFNNIFLMFLRTNTKIFKSEITLFLTKTLKSVAILFLALNLSLFLTPLLILGFIYLFAELGAIIIFLIISRKEFNFSKPYKNIVFEYIKDAKALILYSILFYFTQNIGNIILFNSHGEEALAYFNLVNIHIITVLASITLSIRPLYLSLFSKYFENDDIPSIKFTIYTVEKYSSIFYLGIVLVILINAELIFQIFLPNYMASVPIIYIMIFSPYLVSIARPYYFQLIPGKKQTQSALLDSTVQLISLFLIVILTPYQLFGIPLLGLGGIGFAIALTLPRIFFVIMAYHFSKKYFNIPNQKKIFIHLLCALISFLISFYIKYFILQFVISNTIILLVITSIIVIGTYFFLLILFKEFDKTDFKFFVNLFEPKSYSKSLKDEFK
jgi:O-antigen/teichoic acid export membrane protein